MFGSRTATGHFSGHMIFTLGSFNGFGFLSKSFEEGCDARIRTLSRIRRYSSSLIEWLNFKSVDVLGLGHIHPIFQLYFQINGDREPPNQSYANQR